MATVICRKMRGGFVKWFAAIVIVSPMILSATSPAVARKFPKTDIVAFVFENDVFYKTDRDYTAGMAFIWVSEGEPVPDWALRIAHLVPGFPEKEHVRHTRAFGQNVYTPRNINLADPPRDDRPYAGWLYGTLGLGVERGYQLDQVALTLGIVGPASFAEENQKAVHKVIGTNQPKGWETQLRNEPGILLTYQRSWRKLVTKTLFGLESDLTPHFGDALGNVYTYANAGFTLRFGKRLPLDFGPPRIPPSIQRTGFFASTNKFTWYLFAAFDGRAVARNIFLDGNTFRHSRSVAKEPFVGDLQCGIVMTWREARLGYTRVQRTREFKKQGGHDQFGAVCFSMSF